MNQKTITINIPESGDLLPFTVLDLGTRWIRYDEEGWLGWNDDLPGDAAAAALNIPTRVSVNPIVGGIQEFGGNWQKK